jgi:hypothetical protein
LVTATADAAGIVTNDSAGSGVDAGFIGNDGFWWVDLSAAIPDPNTNIIFEYDPVDPASEREESLTGVAPDSAGTLTFTLAEEPVPGSVEVSYVLKHGTETAVAEVTQIMGRR